MSLFQASLILGSATAIHTLTVINPGREPAVREFRASKLIYNGKSLVQRGKLLVDGKPDVDVVCKIAQGDLVRIQHEAKLYADPQHLEKVQGRFVPYFHGYYECTVNRYGREVRMGCMVLEDCGRTIVYKELCKDAFKHKIIRALIHLHHEAHLEHGDFHFDSGWRHLLVKEDGSVRLIDFDHAIEHRCGQAIPVDLWQYEPSLPEFGCMEMYSILQRLSVWTPSHICVQGSYYPIFRVPTPERLLKLIQHRRPKKINERLERQVQQAYRDYYLLWQRRFHIIGHPRQHKKPLNIPGVDESDDDEPIPPLPKTVWRPARMHH